MSLEGLCSNVFNNAVQKELLSPEVYEAYYASIETGNEMSKEHMKEYAAVLFKWALDKGAVNFSHVFFPVRGMKSGTKTDAFVDLNYGDKTPLKSIKVDFDAGKLFMSETDGSSFPNGGLRCTHTAAAYMVIDKSSNQYIKDDVLYIPACFIAWTGEALDYKTPLLRSQEAVSREGTRLCHNMGFTDVKKVHANVGCEQEFFAIPRELAAARPDILATGRTLFGAATARGQELSDHYFGRIYPRVKAFLKEFQAETWKLGISSVVYHNEVAPAQHEWSPIFSIVNQAADQNILATEVAEEIGLKHDLLILHHEKPFAGINGSGKHCNWGLNSDTGMNLFTTGKTKETEALFIAFTTALTHGVSNYGEAIRCSVASSGNDHRLGAQEAPPAIISIATGKLLEAKLEEVAKGGELSGYTAKRYGEATMGTGSRATGKIGRGTEDRNRTAPLPFCGNRFEFRAVGSAQNISVPLTVINTVTAEGCAAISDLIESGKSSQEAVTIVLNNSKRAIFNGNGYSSEWHKEATEVRGLSNLATTADAWSVWDSEKNKALFDKHKIYTPAETVAVKNINLERYVLDLEIEADTMVKMVNQAILPACAADLKAYDGTGLAGSRKDVYSAMASALTKLVEVRAAAPHDADPVTAANYAKDQLKPAMNALRAAQDTAEGLIDSKLYPFPTYEDMLFPHQFQTC